jgi:Mrp family chromosome partitioning ATPase
LHILPTGAVPPDPGEWIGSQSLAAILAALRDRADIVLVDTAPVLHVGDTLALSERVDAFVVVSRLKSARRGVLAELRRQLDRAPVAKLGVVVVGTPSGASYDSTAYTYGNAGYYPKRDLIA